MNYCNIINKIESDELPTKYGHIHAGSWENAKELHKENGWRILNPSDPIQEEYTIIDISYVDNGDTATKVITTKLTSEIESEAMTENVIKYGQKIGTLGALLGVFGLSFPTTQDEATPVIYATLKANPSLAADSLLLLTVYQNLLTELTDAQIYEISKNL